MRHAQVGAGRRGERYFAGRCRSVDRAGSAVDRYAEGRAAAFVSGCIAIHQFIAFEVVFRVAGLVPLLQEVHVERDVQAYSGIAVLQRKDVLRLVLDFEAGVAMLHPDVIAEHDHLPERLVVAEFQGDLLAGLAQFREAGNAGLDFLVEGQ